MNQSIIGCDGHKRYSVFTGINESGQWGLTNKVRHNREEFRQYLNSLPPQSLIVVESIGNWYWMIDEMERAGHEPLLVDAAKAKKQMGQINKTDKLDSRGLAILGRNGTAPAVWIAPSEIRDQRELIRMRMALVGIRTLLKNRIHAILAKYNIQIEEVSDVFGAKGKKLLVEHMAELPPYTQQSAKEQLELLDQVIERMERIEDQIKQIVEETPAIQLLKSLPGVGHILAIVIAWEVGEIERFMNSERLASYAGTVPRVKSSGGRTFYGKTRPDVNRYLKWAFVEAATCAVLNKEGLRGTHVIELYERIRAKKGHNKAIVAMARHLAEATYWMLKKQEIYRQPRKNVKPISSTLGVSAALA